MGRFGGVKLAMAWSSRISDFTTSQTKLENNQQSRVFKSCPMMVVKSSTPAGGREPEPLTPAGAALTSPRLLQLHSGHEVVRSEQTAYQAGPTAPTD